MNRIASAKLGVEMGRDVVIGTRGWSRRLVVAAVVAGGAAFLGFMTGCSKPDEASAAAVEVSALATARPEPAAPVVAPHPTTEDGVLQAFTQALELQDLAALRRILAPELAAELMRLHDMNPPEFWSRGGQWVENAKTGLSIATRADNAFKVARWRALVRFGNGVEETVEFTQLDGKLLLAEP